MNSDSVIPIPQLITAIATPSASTICRTDALEAPIARRTPTSRTRSIMLMLMVVANPEPAHRGHQQCHQDQESNHDGEQQLVLGLDDLGRLGAASGPYPGRRSADRAAPPIGPSRLCCLCSERPGCRRLENHSARPSVISVRVCRAKTTRSRNKLTPAKRIPQIQRRMTRANQNNQGGRHRFERFTSIVFRPMNWFRHSARFLIIWIFSE